MAKSNDNKEKILSKAIELFSVNGYTKTPATAIAAELGITVQGVYHYYSSKEAILAAIFDEFKNNFYKYRPSVEDVLKAAETQPLHDVLKMVFFSFGKDEEYARMMKLSRIIMALLYVDKNAAKLYKDIVIDEGRNFTIAVFEGLQKMGLAKIRDVYWAAYNLHAFSVQVYQDNLDTPLGPDEEFTIDYKHGIEYLCAVTEHFFTKTAGVEIKLPE